MDPALLSRSTAASSARAINSSLLAMPAISESSNRTSPSHANIIKIRNDSEADNSFSTTCSSAEDPPSPLVAAIEARPTSSGKRSPSPDESGSHAKKKVQISGVNSYSPESLRRTSRPSLAAKRPNNENADPRRMSELPVFAPSGSAAAGAGARRITLGSAIRVANPAASTLGKDFVKDGNLEGSGKVVAKEGPKLGSKGARLWR